jgi:hypothetical protein
LFALAIRRSRRSSKNLELFERIRTDCQLGTTRGQSKLLELVRAPLPGSPELDPHFDTSVNILLASLIVYSKLKYISVLVVS